MYRLISYSISIFFCFNNLILALQIYCYFFVAAAADIEYRYIFIRFSPFTLGMCPLLHTIVHIQYSCLLREIRSAKPLCSLDTDKGGWRASTNRDFLLRVLRLILPPLQRLQTRRLLFDETYIVYRYQSSVQVDQGVFMRCASLDAHTGNFPAPSSIAAVEIQHSGLEKLGNLYL